MTLDAPTLCVVAATAFLISFSKGALGGGFAILGIPLMALVMDPISAGALLAPMLCFTDVAALRYWRSSTWSKPDLMVLLPGLVVGMGLGFLVLSYADRHLVAISIALITLLFTGLWFKGGGQIVPKPRSTARGSIAGFASGMGSMIAHSGGPPVSMYLLPLGLPKAMLAGTFFIYFVITNLLKVVPWMLLVSPSLEFYTLLALAVPIIPLGTWVGWVFHTRINQLQLYRACYALLTLAGLKLLWDGLRGYGLA